MLEKLKKAFSPSEQSEKSEEEIASHVRKKVEESRASANRVANESNWFTNIAYLCGMDGIYFNANSRTFQSIDRAGTSIKRNRVHVNKILPTIQNRLARLCKNPPKYDVRPESNGNEDKEAARLGAQVLAAIWDRQHLNEKRIPLYMWVQQAGHAYGKVSWDVSLGELMPDMGGGAEFEGDVAVNVVSPFEIFPNPQAKSFEEALRTWIIEAKVRPLDYFRLHYPEKGHLIKEEDAWLLSAMYEGRVNSLIARNQSQGGMQEQMKNCAIELTKYEAPSKEHPEGRMIVAANGILLCDKPLPLGEIPFARFDDIPVGGKYYPEAVITHLRPIQDQYNELMRRKAAWIRKFVAGKYAVPRGANLGEETLHNGESEVIEFDVVPNAIDSGRPSAVQVPSLPQWVFQEEERLDKVFNDISGISEVSRGTIPSASIPAIGMQLLTEQDDTRIGVMTEQHEHAWARIGSLILKAVERGYTLKRKLKIAGPDLAYTVREFSGEMLRGNTDAYVIRGSTLPGSKTLKRQEILNAFNMGLLGDPADPKVKEKVLSLIEFGDTNGIWRDYALTMAQTKKVIKAIEEGQPIEMVEFDNHALWLQELNAYRLGDKYDSLDPEKKGVLLEVMEACLQELIAKSPEGQQAALAEELEPVMAAQDEVAALGEVGSSPLDAPSEELVPNQPQPLGNV